MFSTPATRYFYGTADADRVVSADPIKIVGIVVSNYAQTVDKTMIFADNDNNELYRFNVPRQSTYLADIELLADNGFKGLDNGVLKCTYTVFYNVEGA